ncbi:MAG: hypothetical protein R2743_10050 [Ilumatobacteraceae bacterium]
MPLERRDAGTVDELDVAGVDQHASRTGFFDRIERLMEVEHAGMVQLTDQHEHGRVVGGEGDREPQPGLRGIVEAFVHAWGLPAGTAAAPRTHAGCSTR